MREPKFLGHHGGNLLRPRGGLPPLATRIRRGVGVDVSISMLEAAQTEHRCRPIGFVQGDATNLPLRSAAFDNVFMLGGIHHVTDLPRLF